MKQMVNSGPKQFPIQFNPSGNDVRNNAISSPLDMNQQQNSDPNRNIEERQPHNQPRAAYGQAGDRQGRQSSKSQNRGTWARTSKSPTKAREIGSLNMQAVNNTTEFIGTILETDRDRDEETPNIFKKNVPKNPFG